MSDKPQIVHLWDPPEVQNGESVKNGFYDFWVESHTHGKNGKVFMNGQLLRGVTAVKTAVGVNDATTVTITFIARTLNKGTRPDG